MDIGHSCSTVPTNAVLMHRDQLTPQLNHPYTEKKIENGFMLMYAGFSIQIKPNLKRISLIISFIFWSPKLNKVYKNKYTKAHPRHRHIKILSLQLFCSLCFLSLVFLPSSLPPHLPSLLPFLLMHAHSPRCCRLTMVPSFNRAPHFIHPGTSIVNIPSIHISFGPYDTNLHIETCLLVKKIELKTTSSLNKYCITQK